MAKVKDFDEITLSELDGNDIFYVIDYKTEGDPDPKSKKITYSRLTQDLNDHVGLNSLLTADTFKYDDKTYLCMVFELKNGSQKTLCVDVGDFINIYQGDGITISVDSENNIKVIASYLSSTTKLSEIESNEIQKYQLKSELSNKLALSSLNDLQGDNIVYDKTNKRLSAQYYTHPTYESHTSELYKITVDSTGHVTSAINVQKDDITDLGIPGQDTTYTAGSGLKLEGTSFSVSADYASKSDLSTYGGSNSIDVSGESNKTISVKIDPKGNLIVTDNGLSSGGSGGATYSFDDNGLSVDKTNKVSIKIGANLTFDSNGKLSAGGGSNYNSGNGISIDNSNNINVIVADDGKLSFTTDNKLSVGDFLSRITVINWKEPK